MIRYKHFWWFQTSFECLSSKKKMASSWKVGFDCSEKHLTICRCRDSILCNGYLCRLVSSPTPSLIFWAKLWYVFQVRTFYNPNISKGISYEHNLWKKNILSDIFFCQESKTITFSFFKNTWHQYVQLSNRSTAHKF